MKILKTNLKFKCFVYLIYLSIDFFKSSCDCVIKENIVNCPFIPIQVDH